VSLHELLLVPDLDAVDRNSVTVYSAADECAGNPLVKFRERCARPTGMPRRGEGNAPRADTHGSEGHVATMLVQPARRASNVHAGLWVRPVGHLSDTSGEGVAFPGLL
jgi:hypothetical protein